MYKESPLQNSLLRITGAVVALCSLILGLLVVFVVPSSCSFVSALALVTLFFLFIIGGSVFLIGQLLSWRKHKLKPAGSE